MPRSNPLGSLPVYQRVSERLIREIGAGRLADGQRLPPERLMAQQLGISVGTLRKALADLTQKGLVRRVHGSGNYVQASSRPQGLYAFFRIELREGGGLPTARILDVTRLDKPADLPPFGASLQAHRIRRLRFLNDLPCVLEEIWLDGDYAEHLDAADLSESLYWHYRRALNLWITHARDSVGLDPVPDWSPPTFPLPPGTPCGYVERLSGPQDEAGEERVAEFSRNWFDPALARYVARLG